MSEQKKTGQNEAKFVIVVGSISKPLGLIPKLEAIRQAMDEDLKAAKIGNIVKLLEQTADCGAVNIPFKGL